MWNVRTSIDANSKANWDIVPCDVRSSSVLRAIRSALFLMFFRSLINTLPI